MPRPKSDLPVTPNGNKLAIEPLHGNDGGANMASQYYKYPSSKQMPCLLRNVSGMGKAYFQSSLQDETKF